MGLFSFFKKKKKNEIEKAEAVSVKEAPKAEVKPELDAEPNNAETVEVSEAPVAQAAPEAKNNVKEAPEAKAAEKPKNASPKNQSAQTKSKAKPAESENADKKPAAKAEMAEEKPVLKTKSEAAQKKEATKATAKNKKQPADAEPSAQPKAEEAAEANATGAEKITGRFEIKKAKDGRYVFNLYAANHVIVATSQVYSSSQSALVGINSVIANADKAPIEDQSLKSYETYGYPKWEIYVDKGGQYRFRLYAANGSCICHSQGYTSKTNCKNGIDSIIRSSRNAEVDKSYLKKEDK